MRSTYCFSVLAVADPSTLPRVVEVLSVHGLIPARCHGQTSGPNGSSLVIDLQLDAITVAQATSVARRLGRVVTVENVLWSEKVQRRAA